MSVLETALARLAVDMADDAITDRRGHRGRDELRPISEAHAGVWRLRSYSEQGQCNPRDLRVLGPRASCVRPRREEVQASALLSFRVFTSRRVADMAQVDRGIDMIDVDRKQEIVALMRKEIRKQEIAALMRKELRKQLEMEAKHAKPVRPSGLCWTAVTILGVSTLVVAAAVATLSHANGRHGVHAASVVRATWSGTLAEGATERATGGTSDGLDAAAHAWESEETDRRVRTDESGGVHVGVAEGAHAPDALDANEAALDAADWAMQQRMQILPLRLRTALCSRGVPAWVVDELDRAGHDFPDMLQELRADARARCKLPDAARVHGKLRRATGLPLGIRPPNLPRPIRPYTRHPAEHPASHLTC